MASNLVFICTLLKLYENNELIRSVVRVFSNENRSVILITQVIYRELKETSNFFCFFFCFSMNNFLI